MALPEITAPVSLTRTDGRLDPAAVGWGRQPLVDLLGWCEEVPNRW